MKTVAVTGSTGFIGSRLCKHVIDDGRELRRALRLACDQDGVVVGDLGPETDWSGALTGVEAVVHLAARVHVMKDDSADPLAVFRYVNTEGTLNLARQAAAASVRRFIYLSTIKVNGETTGCVGSAESSKAFREDDVPNPQDPYAISKWEAEQGLMALARETEMEVVIIRPPLVYGPGVKGNFSSMMRWIEKGVPLPLGAVRDNRRSFVALDNLVDLIVTCLDHPSAANEVFLVGDAEDLSTTELLQRVARAMGRRVRLVPVPVRLLVAAAKLLGKQAVAQRLFGSLQVDISKARDVLGWEPPVSIDVQLRRIVSREL